MRTKWKILENYPKYEISEYGEIRHIKNKKVLKPRLNGNYVKHYYVDLSYDRQKAVHRLVYQTFVGPLDGAKVIDHIDNNPLNNHYTNLRQVFTIENTHNGRRCKKVKVNDLIFPSIRQLAFCLNYANGSGCLEQIVNSKKFKNRFGGDAIITYENEIISVSTKNS